MPDDWMSDFFGGGALVNAEVPELEDEYAAEDEDIGSSRVRGEPGFPKNQVKRVTYEARARKRSQLNPDRMRPHQIRCTDKQWMSLAKAAAKAKVSRAAVLRYIFSYMLDDAVGKLLYDPILREEVAGAKGRRVAEDEHPLDSVGSPGVPSESE